MGQVTQRYAESGRNSVRLAKHKAIVNFYVQPTTREDVVSLEICLQGLQGTRAPARLSEIPINILVRLRSPSIRGTLSSPFRNAVPGVLIGPSKIVGQVHMSFTSTTHVCLAV